MSALAEILFGGLFQGSLYAMMAVGLALVWTTIGVFNFSHGVFMMLGAYIAWQLVEFGLPAAVCSEPAATANGLGRELECGTVSINHFAGAGFDTPFGGVKDSGWGREGGAECFDGYLTTKLVSQRCR